jgi:hypothetical protein
VIGLAVGLIVVAGDDSDGQTTVTLQPTGETTKPETTQTETTETTETIPTNTSGGTLLRDPAPRTRAAAAPVSSRTVGEFLRHIRKSSPALGLGRRPPAFA